MTTQATKDYLDAALAIVNQIRDTQLDVIEQAADIFANTIAGNGLVHMFGTGHSRMFLEEMYPRHGSFPGFHPIVELSLTFHNQVVGANGQRQAMFIEHVEGLAQKILRNFVIYPPDSFLIYSNSGVNEVVVDMAVEVKNLGLPLVAVVSRAHSEVSKPRHSSGKKLADLADVVIDNCTPAGDALVRIEGLDDPVGPGSTVGAATVTNAIKVAVAEKLTCLGKPPVVLTSAYFIGDEESNKRFDASYDDYRARIRRVYGG
ncbi:MAG TPA: SIS domain-containing protein [Aggregatilineales bacterium]|nr:SIS domain-containing protein [Aggregatilineales bacterium]